MEVDFLVTYALKDYLSTEQYQASKASIEKVKGKIPVVKFDKGEEFSDTAKPYNTEYLREVSSMYLRSLLQNYA